jgi:hypothetical protein
LLSSLFSFLILLIWVALPHLNIFARGLTILFIFSKNNFLFHCSWYGFWSLFHWFCLVLGLACCCFSKSLRCSIRLFIWDLSVFLIYVLLVINFPLKSAFAVSHTFQ